MIALMAVGSPLAVWLLARLYLLATARVRDAASATVLTFVGTFGVWLLVERVGLSPRRAGGSGETERASD